MFAARRIGGGVPGSMKNLIFAADGPKPEIVPGGECLGPGSATGWHSLSVVIALTSRVVPGSRRDALRACIGRQVRMGERRRRSLLGRWPADLAQTVQLSLQSEVVLLVGVPTWATTPRYAAVHPYSD